MIQRTDRKPRSCDPPNAKPRFSVSGAGYASMRSFGLQDRTDRTLSHTMSWTADQEEIKPSWGCVQGRS